MKLRHAVLAILCFCPAKAFSQQSASMQAPPDAIRVFLDCSYFCDDDFTRTEINYVNWVRDRADAQVHVIVSRLRTGGGGSQYTLSFIGLKNFAGREDTLRYTTNTSDSDDAIRRGITRMLKLGLVRFIATTASASRLQISWSAPAEETKTAAATPTKDPWNFWVFSLGARSNFNGEESQHFTRLNGNVSANRTTDAFKIRIGTYGSQNQSSFTYDPGTGRDTTVVSTQKNYSLDLLGVRSMGQHWSAGFQGGANSATFGNISLGLLGGPALEYSIWPYSEATRRALVFRYSAGIQSYDYREITIYGKVKETHPAHSLTGELDLRQRFGSISLSTEFSQYLHNTSFYSAQIFTNANLKLFKGFSMDFYGNYTKVRDQLSLAAANLTPEEVLLQQRQQKTGYRYFGGFGLRYSFGSIFNNVVNPRFGGGRGGTFFFN